MHMAEGVYYTLPDRKVYLFELYQSRYFDRLRFFRDVCSKAIGGNNIVICIENYGIYHAFQQKGVDLLLESGSFKLTYDIGHDYRVGNYNEAFILERADKLGCMHIHDAINKRDHLPLGGGEINILDKLSLAEEYGCRCVLETKTAEGLKQSVDYINSKWRTVKNAPAVLTDVLSPIVTNRSTNDEKVDLFLSLFRGREDVYARRWESKDGKMSGYSPVCRNEWEYGLCGKPTVKCHECKCRELVPFDKYTVVQHLAGKEIIGVYPMLPDETSRFVAIDFDGEGWQRDVSAVRAVCEAHRIFISVERSRSGNGAHIWFFFDEPVSAVSARKLGTAILTAAMEKRHELRFKSYDRLFPNQDTMPKGGFGNLIALPLQRKPRDQGYSVFVNESFLQYPDQWAFLSSIKRMTTKELERNITVLCRSGELGNLYRQEDDEYTNTPWQKKTPEPRLSYADFPPTLKIIEANMLYIEKDGVSQKALNRLKRFAAFKNPEYFRAQAMRLPVWNKPRVVSVSDETEKFLCLPRGCKSEIKRLLDNCNSEAIWQDERFAGASVDLSFNGVLRGEQSEALKKLIEHDNGVLSATTAFGKTVVAAALIAARKVNSLILVNRQPLLDQWETRLKEFLTINTQLRQPVKKRGRKKEFSVIGRLGGGKNSLNGIIDIAIIQSLVRGNDVKDIVKNYGMVIIDECHHVPAVSFEKVLKEVNAKYIYGLTATPKRQDGLQPIIYMHCGQIRYKDDAKLQAKKRPFEHFIIPRFTSFRLPFEKNNSQLPIQELYAEICQNEFRNDMIVSDVINAVSEGRNLLILTERKSHLEALKNAIKEKTPNVITFVGGRQVKERKRLIERIKEIPETESLVIIATGRYIGEGFDVSRLDTLFLTMPIAWQGTIAQYVGRLHRLHGSKHEVRVYDYVDVHVATLDRMYAKRIKGYSNVGYKVKCETSSLNTGSIIFDVVTFWPVFTADLCSSKQEIILISPFIAKSRTEKMLTLLDKAIFSGTKITIVTRPATDYSEKDRMRITQIIKMLKEHDVTVLERSKIHQKFAVIDGCVAWYGNINLLSFGSSEESIMRLESKYIASELLGTIKHTPRATIRQDKF